MPADAKLFPDVVPLVGLASCVVLAASLTGSVIVTGLSILAVGLIGRGAVRVIVT